MITAAEETNTALILLITCNIHIADSQLTVPEACHISEQL